MENQNNKPEHEHMDNSENKGMIIESIFPDPLPTLDELERKYPPRELREGSMVTRVGPSPTGFMHIGTLYTALLSERFAHQTSGVFFLRIEDTDKKREVEGATDFISEAFDHFKVPIDEGRDISGTEHGLYGPYTQSARMRIYHSYINHLLEQGNAYLCFCTVEDLEGIREKQKNKKARTGYYGEWALWRDRPLEEVAEMLKAGRPYVIRFKATGNHERKIAIDDLIVGRRMLPENDQDIVIMKSDKLPTYHLAHVVDDHLMRTTHVIRGDEWLSSLPTHLQLFEVLGWQSPTYAHIAAIQKLENSSKRKLSKRKDPEANIGYFDEQGYPPDALIEYLLNLANSNFEDWRKANPQSHYREFPLTFEKLRSSNGPLFDFKKLEDISRDILARSSAGEVYEQAIAWAEKYDAPFAELLKDDPDYTKKILSMERGVPNARKDIKKLSDIKPQIDYFFDKHFQLTPPEVAEKLSFLSIEEIKEIVKEFIDEYRAEDSKDEWFEKLKLIARHHNFATSNAELKKNPTTFKGGMAEVAQIFRVLLAGRIQTPDLYTIMQIMGQERVMRRLSVLQS